MSKKYCKKHDAYYDLINDEWLEKACFDPSCDFCRNRPEKPSQVNREDKQ